MWFLVVRPAPSPSDSETLAPPISQPPLFPASEAGVCNQPADGRAGETPPASQKPWPGWDALLIIPHREELDARPQQAAVGLGHEFWAQVTV